MDELNLKRAVTGLRLNRQQPFSFVGVRKPKFSGESFVKKEALGVESTQILLV